MSDFVRFFFPYPHAEIDPSMQVPQVQHKFLINQYHWNAENRTTHVSEALADAKHSKF